MHFNPDKCEVMRFTHRKDKTKPIYSLGGQFRSVENIKDLGVTISSDLFCGKHVFATVNKAKMDKAVHRNKQPGCVFATLQVTGQAYT